MLYLNIQIFYIKRGELMKYLYIIIYTVLIYICFINISLATAATEENINIIWPTSEKGIIT